VKQMFTGLTCGACCAPGAEQGEPVPSSGTAPLGNEESAPLCALVQELTRVLSIRELVMAMFDQKTSSSEV